MVLVTELFKQDKFQHKVYYELSTFTKRRLLQVQGTLFIGFPLVRTWVNPTSPFSYFHRLYY